MAFIACSECGALMSDKAPTCVKCGCPISKTAHETKDTVTCISCGAEVNQIAVVCPKCGKPPARRVMPGVNDRGTAPFPGPQGTACRYAGFWFRTLAAIIDGALSYAVGFFLMLPIGFAVGFEMARASTPQEIRSTTEVLGFILAGLFSWLYYAVSESSGWQGTPGKRMLGLRVVDYRGKRITFGKASARYWSKLVSTLVLFIGFLMVGFTERKQGLHDKIAGTLVVKTPA